MQEISYPVLASETDVAQQAKEKLLQRYPENLRDGSPKEGETIILLGGDGFMLRVLKQFYKKKHPLFGLNLGHLGFLMNPWLADGLIERIQKAVSVEISPLKMIATDSNGDTISSHAFNEVTIFRHGSHSIHLDIMTDDGLKLENLQGDGAIVATPAGSPAYNYSARGPILPLDSQLLALTPINPFQPRGWRGAVLNHNAHIHIYVGKANYRPALACADTLEIPYVEQVEISNDPSANATLLFDPHHDIRTRILKEQFSP